MQSGEHVDFGPYTWRVLAVADDQALLITEQIIALRWYHQAFVDVTWAQCELRTYLNTEIHSQFSPGEQAQIIPVTHANPDNPWFQTPGGDATTDALFLLSLEEVCTYMGDSQAALHNKGAQTWLIDDTHNATRQARYAEDFHGWRLRSPGYYGRTAASVRSDGCVYVRGNGVYGRPRDGGGVRPAVWLKRG